MAAIGCQVAASGCKRLTGQVLCKWLPAGCQVLPLKKSDFVDFTFFQDCSKWLPSGWWGKWLPSGCLSKWLQVAAKWLPSAILKKKSDFVDFTFFQDCSKWLPSGCQVAGGAGGCQVADGASGCQGAGLPSGCKWLPSGCLSKWLQVAANDCSK